MTDYDDTTYTICISTSLTGSGITAYPSGDRMFFVTDKASLPIRFLQKIKDMAAGYSYSTKDGKMSNSATFGDCILVGGKTTFNTMIPKLKDEHRAAEGLLYLWIWGDTSAADWSAGGTKTNYLYIGYTAAGAETNYMSGYLTQLTPEIEGAIYWIKGMQFKECLL